MGLYGLKSKQITLDRVVEKAVCRALDSDNIEAVDTSEEDIDDGGVPLP